jgi:hypothetical protein
MVAKPIARVSAVNTQGASRIMPEEPIEDSVLPTGEEPLETAVPEPLSERDEFARAVQQMSAEDLERATAPYAEGN